MTTIVQWPEVQELLDLEGFEENSILINKEPELTEYGPSAYYIKTDWLNKQKQKEMNNIIQKIEEDKSKFQKVETWKVVFHFHDAVEEISGTLDEIQNAINIVVFNNKDCTNFNCYKL